MIGTTNVVNLIARCTDRRAHASHALARQGRVRGMAYYQSMLHRAICVAIAIVDGSDELVSSSH